MKWLTNGSPVVQKKKKKTFWTRYSEQLATWHPSMGAPVLDLEHQFKDNYLK